jgi:beta-lactamase regulating signal transducer with metallopeptidase domain
MSAPEFLELVVSLSLQVAIVVALAHWVGRFTASEGTQCRVWTACYVLVLGLLAAAILLPHPRLFRPWAEMDARTVAHVATLETRAGNTLFFAWTTGASISLALFAMRSLRAIQFLKSCGSLDSALLSDEGLSRELSRFPHGSPNSTIQVLTSDRLAAPFCWQLHRPYIVLPRFLIERASPELRFIVRHEVEHLRTGHPMQLFLQRLVEIIFWFHPMIWWASHRSALVREFACDEAAVRSPSDIVTYLKSLLKVVEHAAEAKGEAPTSLTFGGGKSVVAARARRLVQVANPTGRTKRLKISGLAAALALALAAVPSAIAWLPLNALASPRSAFSPWPMWSSGILHDLGVHARDYEEYDPRTRIYELHHDIAGRREKALSTP